MDDSLALRSGQVWCDREDVDQGRVHRYLRPMATLRGSVGADLIGSSRKSNSQTLSMPPIAATYLKVAIEYACNFGDLALPRLAFRELSPISNTPPSSTLG
jgi:hypothetical protein